MAFSVSTAGSRITAQAAAVATAMAATTTTAEAQAIGAFLTACGDKPGLFIEIVRLINNKELTEKR
jgi:hypothetical protein